MPKYPFLSDEWVAEAKRIYAEAGPSLLAGAAPAPVKVNLVVTGAPFSDGPVNAHLDTSDGKVTIDAGHLPDPDVTVSLDYVTARGLFIAGDTQALMQAFLSGRVRVDGNLSKLLDPSSGIWPGSPGLSSGASQGAAGPDAAVGSEERLSPGQQQQMQFRPATLQLATRLQEMTE